MASNGTLSDFSVGGVLTVTTVAAATIDTDKFLVHDGTTIKYRTGTQLLSDIGAAAAQIQIDTQDPTGFNRQDSVALGTISFTDVSRTFTHALNGGNISFYQAGVKYTKASNQTVVIPNTEGIHFIYYDGTQTLVSSQVVWEFGTNTTFVAAVYWSVALQKATVYDERHGISMDWATHRYLHLTQSSAYIDGFTPSVTVEGSGNVDADCELQLLTQGRFLDEDILHQALDQSVFEKWWLNGSNWEWDVASAAIVKNAPAGLPYYNQETSPGVHTLTELISNDYMCMHLFATNKIGTNKSILILGQVQYSTVGNARLGATSELANLNLDGLPEAEMVPIATFIIQGRSSYSNTYKARLRSTDLGDDYIDWRVNEAISSGGVSASDHGALSGLADDDHLQYHNDARALTWLGTRFSVAATDIKMNGVQSLGALSTLARADHIHPVDTSRAAALSGTINTIAYWNSTTTIASLATATYPSLTELSYVKGVTSAIQTQINAKLATSSVSGTSGYIPKFTGTNAIGNSLIYDDGTNIGIGTTTPAAKLDVAGSIKIGTTGTVIDAGSYMAFEADAGKNIRITTQDYPYHVGINVGNTGVSSIYLGVNSSGGNGTIKIRGANAANSTDANEYVNFQMSASGLLVDLFKGSYFFDGGAFLFNIDNNDLDFRVDGTSTNLIRTDATTNFVGIGTALPKSKLHVQNSSTTIAWSPTAGTSAIFESNTSSRNFVNIVGHSTGQSELWFGNQTTEVRGRVRYEHATDTLSLWAAAGQKLTVLSSGNVGIGTTSPAQKLSVKGTGDTRILLGDGTQDWSFSAGQSGAGKFNILQEGVSGDIFVIDTAGRIGIGTTSPSEKLDVVGNIKASGNIQSLAGGYFQSSNAYDWGSAGTIGIQIGTNGSDEPEIDFRRWTGTGTIHHVASIRQKINGSEFGLYFNTDVAATNTIATTTRMYISPSGNIGIGTTAPSAKFQVVGGSDAWSGIVLKDGGTNIPQIDFNVSDNSTRGRIEINDVNAGTGDALTFKAMAGTLNTIMTLRGGGNVGIGTTAPATALDVNGIATTIGVTTNVVTVSTTGTLAWDFAAGANAVMSGAATGDVTINISNWAVGGIGTFLFRQGSGTARTCTLTRGGSDVYVLMGTNSAVNTTLGSYTTITLKKFGSNLYTVIYGHSSAVYSGAP